MSTSSQMKRVAFAVAAALSLASGTAAWAATSDTQDIQYTIANISTIDIAAGAVVLAVNSATAGSAPDADVETSSYDITTNASTNGKAITASIGSNITATGVTLEVNVTAPGSGTGGTYQPLSITPVTVVTGIQGTSATNVPISYRLTATVNALPTTVTQVRTVTYTITDL
jgi:hypothetical protein